MIPLNVQPAEKKIVREDGLLDVHSIWLTMQGEGPFAGTPAVFIRLAACNLQCPLCDTIYLEGRHLMTPLEILDEVKQQSTIAKLVVITGGEPFRQALGCIISLLLQNGYKVQIETNGTLWDESLVEEVDEGVLYTLEDHVTYSGLVIVCSPKTGSLHGGLAPYIRHLKYILRAGYVAEDGLPTDSLGGSVAPARPWSEFYENEGTIWVQPADQQDEKLNRLNVLAAIDSCMKHGYRMSVQTHKILGLP